MSYTVTDLTRVHARRTVLEISHLTLSLGNIYALLGPNGAGKTTLLNILAFLDRPTSGTIYFDGKLVAFTAEHLLRLRRQVVMVDQQPILFSTTVYKNLEFGLKVRKIPKRQRENIITEALEWVGMQSFTHAPAGNLSGGETQRVAIARALAVAPKVLLCDEPTSSVDVEHQAGIMNILRRINAEQHITVIFTTHDRLQAAAFAHETLYLDHGRLSNVTHENYFSAQLTQNGPNAIDCRIQNHVRLSLPMHSVPHMGRVRLTIDPRKIEWCEGPMAKPDPSCLHGKIMQISEEKDQIRMTVDIGIWITVIISHERYLERRPLVGDVLALNIRPEAIQILEPSPGDHQP
jgi:tungstate transport system ATP-binding protein